MVLLSLILGVGERMNEKELKQKLNRLQSTAYKLQNKLSELISELDKKEEKNE